VLFRRKKIGLALGGGSVRGFAHLGVLKVIEEYRVPINYIAGTSIGAVFGALYSSGLPVEKIISIANKIRWGKLFTAFSINIGGLSSSVEIEKLVKRFIPQDSFKELKIPLKVIVTNITDGVMELRDSGSLSKAVRISATFPGLYSPVEEDGKMYCDGGMMSQVPVEIVKKMGADYVVGVDVLPYCQMKKKHYNALVIMDRSIDLMLQQQIKYKRKTLLLKPVDKFINSLDIKKKTALIKMGEQSARAELIPFLKRKKII